MAGIHVRATRLAVGEPMTDDGDAILLEPDLPLHLTATSDAAGAFRINGVAPGSTVGIDVVDDRSAQLTFRDVFKVPAVGSPLTKMITLHRAGLLTGRVVRDGKPVAGIGVGAQSVNLDTGGHPNEVDGWGEGVTDSDGRYVIKRLPSTNYNIALRLDDKQQAEFTAVAHDSVPLRGGQTVGGVDFQPISGAVIEGVVRDSEGRAVANTLVGVFGPAHPRTGPWVQGASTDAKGRYLLRVPPGMQFVYSMVEGGGDKGKTVFANDGSTTTVNLRL
ncbi:MAG: carboxypeptidase-like regulatory domain-containing protein [Fimbriimonadaceae bacterium]